MPYSAGRATASGAYVVIAGAGVDVLCLLGRAAREMSARAVAGDARRASSAGVSTHGSKAVAWRALAAGVIAPQRMYAIAMIAAYAIRRHAMRCYA